MKSSELFLAIKIFPIGVTSGKIITWPIAHLLNPHRFLLYDCPSSSTQDMAYEDRYNLIINKMDMSVPFVYQHSNLHI